MKQPIFTGVCTALVTPFLGGQVNYPMLGQLLRRQQEAKIPAALIAGTTGESATLSDAEKGQMIAYAKKTVGDEMLILAGTGSNSTAHACALSREAESSGADALLVVTPYYNKATESGLIAHYFAIADAVSIPVIVYNVPSRTGVDISPQVYHTLSEHPNIAGVKEASTDIGKILAIRALCADELPIWSGNDDLTAAVMALGGKGVISVASNLAPQTLHALTGAALDGDFDTAADLQLQLHTLNRLLFCEVNPIPIKHAMRCIGYDCGACRLPLTALRPENARALAQHLQSVRYT